jgi:hypothetical protein
MTYSYADTYIAQVRELGAASYSSISSFAWLGFDASLRKFSIARTDSKIENFGCI